MVDFLSTAVSPWSQPNSWDTIQIGSVSWYGKFEIEGFARKYNWNIAAGWGFQGAFEIFQAQPPAEGSITFYVWADSQYSTYLALVGVLTYSPSHLPPNNASGASSATNALNIVHPMLQNNSITQVIVKSIGPLKKQSDDLLFSFTVEFAEFAPQRAFPPQVPDTSADPNDPSVTPENQALINNINTVNQQLTNNIRAMGGSPLP